MRDDAAWEATGLQDEIDYGLSPTAAAVPAAMYAAWADLATGETEEDAKPPNDDSARSESAFARRTNTPLMVGRGSRGSASGGPPTPTRPGGRPFPAGAVSVSRVPANAVLVTVDMDRAEGAITAAAARLAAEDAAYGEEDDGPFGGPGPRGKRVSQVGYI